MEKEHTHVCEEENCGKELNSSAEMEKHIVDNHTYECVKCYFKGRTESIMENHILSQHTTADIDNKFQCDECSVRCETKEESKTHFRKQHKESLFQDSLYEVNQVKSEYEAKIIEENDKFRTVKAENEELKKKVDVPKPK